jgi:hypothetical protein
MGANHKYFDQRFHDVGKPIGTISGLRGYILPMLYKCCFGPSLVLDMLRS